jgi:hypothetical protein
VGVESAACSVTTKEKEHSLFIFTAAITSTLVCSISRIASAKCYCTDAVGVGQVQPSALQNTTSLGAHRCLAERWVSQQTLLSWAQKQCVYMSWCLCCSTTRYYKFYWVAAQPICANTLCIETPYEGCAPLHVEDLPLCQRGGRRAPSLTITQHARRHSSARGPYHVRRKVNPCRRPQRR